MREDLRQALFIQVRKGLEIVLAASDGHYDTHRIWRRQPDSGWHGTHENRQSYLRGFMASRQQLDELAGELQPHWATAYPQFAGGDALIISGLGGGNINLSKIISALVSQTLNRKPTTSPSDAVIHQAIDRLGQELHASSVRGVFLAPLVGFQIPDSSVNEIRLDDQVSIVRLTEDDVEELHGGSVFDHNGSGSPNMIWDFAFRGEFDLPLLFDMKKVTNDTMNRPELIRAHLRSLARSLAVFKNGHVEYDRARHRAAYPSALIFGAQESTSHARGRHGSYSIAPSEIASLKDHVKRMNRPLYSALETACRRLADAESRHNAVDAISDAIIGLEALLSGDGEREGLRFKFAMNYASLARPDASDERKARYRDASDLYSIRGGLFHGADGGGALHKFAGSKLPLSEIMPRSCEMLRETIKTFLLLEGVPENEERSKKFFKEYWLGRYFGTSETRPSGG